MPINFGSATTSAFYVGSTAASAIYQGTTQVWPTATGVGTDPTTVTGLTSMWSADSLTAVADATPVTSFPSTAGSGTNNTMTQSSANAPLYYNAVQNGLPVIRGDGTKNMFTSSAMSPGIANTSTTFIVAKYNTFASSRGLFDGAATNSYRLYSSNATQMAFFAVSGGTTAYTFPNNTAWHVFAVRRLGTGTNGLELWIDGTRVGQGTSASTTVPTQFRFYSDGTANQSAAADIGQAVQYAQTAIADADLTGITRFLGNKWGITVA